MRQPRRGSALGDEGPLEELVLSLLSALGLRIPLIFIALIALRHHSEANWIALALVVLYQFTISGLAQNRIANESLSDFASDLLDPERFTLTEVPLPKEFGAKARLLQKFKRRVFGRLLKPVSFYWNNKALAVFTAEPLGGRLLGQAKAFLNPFGTSFIVLNGESDNGDHSRFVLHHEFAHLSLAGEKQAILAERGRTQRVFTVLFLAVCLTHWWQIAIVLVYPVYVWFVWNSPASFVEALADSQALQEVQEAQKQRLLVEDLIVIQEDLLVRGDKPQRLSALGRLWWLRRALRQLGKTGRITKLSRWNGVPWPYDLPFAGVFLAWALPMSRVPMLCIVLLVILLAIGESNRWRKIKQWKLLTEMIRQRLRNIAGKAPSA